MTGARGSWHLLAKKPHGRLCLNMGILPSSHVPLACGFCPRHRQSQLGVLVARGVLSPLAFFTCPEGPRASSPHPTLMGEPPVPRLSSHSPTTRKGWLRQLGQPWSKHRQNLFWIWSWQYASRISKTWPHPHPQTHSVFPCSLII